MRLCALEEKKMQLAIKTCADVGRIGTVLLYPREIDTGHEKV